MSDPSDYTISVIVPVHRGEKPFHRCLSSLKALEPAPHEIIVVADGDPESARVAETMGVQVVRTPAAGGPARARNLGAQHARGDILFFIDADVTVSPDAITRLDTLFTQDPNLTAVIGSYDDQPAASNFLSRYKNLMHHYVHQISQETASTFWGACGAIHRDTFLAMSGFDERYRHPSIEDIELGYRLAKAGYRIRLDKALQIKHLKRWTVTSLLRADFFQRALPWTQIILRDRHFVNDLNLRFSDRASVVLAYSLLGTLLAASVWWTAFAIAAILILALLGFNMPVYRFFYRKCGFWFAIQAVPWHWLYYIYSGLAFAIGVVRHMLSLKDRSLKAVDVISQN